MKHSAKKNRELHKKHTVLHTTKNNAQYKSVLKFKTETLSSRIGIRCKRFGKRALRSLLLSNLFQKIITGVVSIVFVSVCLYGVYHYFRNTFINDVIVSQSEIIDRVAKLSSLPEGKPEAVVRVEDAEILKKQNIFYENVKVGDYILMYPKIAVIYDLRNNTIVAIKKSE